MGLFLFFGCDCLVGWLEGDYAFPFDQKLEGVPVRLRRKHLNDNVGSVAFKT